MQLKLQNINFMVNFLCQH